MERSLKTFTRAKIGVSEGVFGGDGGEGAFTEEQPDGGVGRGGEEEKEEEEVSREDLGLEEEPYGISPRATTKDMSPPYSIP